MKLFWVLLVVLTGSFSLADQEETSQYPYPPGPTYSAKAVYFCSPNNYLAIELYSYAGAQRRSFYLDKADFCKQQVTAFSAKTRITDYTAIAICSPYNNLIRIPLSPYGTFGKIVSTYAGTREKCLANAKAINESP